MTQGLATPYTMQLVIEIDLKNEEVATYLTRIVKSSHEPTIPRCKEWIGVELDTSARHNREPERLELQERLPPSSLFFPVNDPSSASGRELLEEAFALD